MQITLSAHQLWHSTSDGRLSSPPGSNPFPYFPFLSVTNTGRERTGEGLLATALTMAANCGNYRLPLLYRAIGWDNLIFAWQAVIAGRCLLAVHTDNPPSWYFVATMAAAAFGRSPSRWLLFWRYRGSHLLLSKKPSMPQWARYK